ncbi:ABC transporter ATP-binding protein, partial [bacterium]|nr:ABC transporter ATP-binding protein [bacterium]
TGGMRFTDTWIEDGQGNRISSAASGRPLKILASYVSDETRKIKDLKVSFAVFTLSNIAVTDLSNVTTGDLFLQDIPGQGVFSCLIPKLPLNAGTYVYNVFAMTGKGIQDWIQQAGTFTVESGDYFGSGNIPDRTRLMFIDHAWSVHEKE